MYRRWDKPLRPIQNRRQVERCDEEKYPTTNRSAPLSEAEMWVSCWLLSCGSLVTDAAVSKNISSRCDRARRGCLIPSRLQRHKGEEWGRRQKCVCKTASVAERRGAGRTASLTLSQKGRLWDGAQSLQRLELVSMEMTLEWCWLPIDCSRGSRLQEREAAGGGQRKKCVHSWLILFYCSCA